MNLNFTLGTENLYLERVKKTKARLSIETGHPKPHVT
jgi:hypothetical protein